MPVSDCSIGRRRCMDLADRDEKGSQRADLVGAGLTRSQTQVLDVLFAETSTLGVRIYRGLQRGAGARLVTVEIDDQSSASRSA